MTTPAIEAVVDSLPYPGIDFGYCGVSQSTSKSFTLHNPTSSKIRYHFQSDGTNFTCNVEAGKSQFERIFHGSFRGAVSLFEVSVITFCFNRYFGTKSEEGGHCHLLLR